MTRNAIHWLSRKLAPSDSHQTRAVEYMLAWMTVTWSIGLFAVDGAINVPVYSYLAELAPRQAWGGIGCVIGMARFVALVINGSMRRTPEVRFAGAFFGACWWSLIFGLFCLAIYRDGSPAFPMLFVYPVIVYFEGYSCFRCGQDATAMSCSPVPPRGLVAYTRATGDG